MIDTLRISKSERRVLLYTLIIGLVAHGFMLFNKFSLNDDNDCLFRLGLTYPQGRWLIGIFDDAFQALGTYNVSLPLFNGVLALLLIALSSCYICKALNITDTKLQIILGALMETVIEVTAVLGFMFSAWCNALGILMSAVSALLCIRVYEKQLSRKCVIISCLLLCCSLGIYQAYFSFFVCIVLIRLLLESSIRNITATSIVRESCLYCLTCVLAVACYLAINSAFLNIKGVSMTTYQGMDNWGMAGGAGQYVTRIINAYVAFFLPQRFNVTIFPELIGKLYPIVLIIILLCLIALFRIAAQRKGSRIVNYAALTFFSLTLPLAFNFHYILSDTSNIHSQMIHSSVFTYILIIAACQQACDFTAFPNAGKFIKNVLMCFLLIVCVLYVRVDNILYLKAYTTHENDMSYLTTLVTRITSTDGYSQEMPLYLSGASTIEQEYFEYDSRLDIVMCLPYRDQVEQNMDLVYFMRNWCGFTQPTVDSISDECQRALNEMAYYPNYDSIRIVDDIILVKFPSSK